MNMNEHVSRHPRLPEFQWMTKDIRPAALGEIKPRVRPTRNGTQMRLVILREPDVSTW